MYIVPSSDTPQIDKKKRSGRPIRSDKIQIEESLCFPTHCSITSKKTDESSCLWHWCMQCIHSWSYLCVDEDVFAVIIVFRWVYSRLWTIVRRQQQEKKKKSEKKNRDMIEWQTPFDQHQLIVACTMLTVINKRWTDVSSFTIDRTLLLFVDGMNDMPDLTTNNYYQWWLDERTSTSAIILNRRSCN
jgi:hypothetical protein